MDNNINGSLQSNISNIDEEKIDFDISRLIRKLLKKWWLFLILILLLSTSGYIIARLTFVPQYEATGTLAINVNKTVNGQQSSNYSDLQSAQLLVNTVQELIVSDISVQKALDKMSNNYNLTIEQVKEMVTTVLIQDTIVISLKVTSEDPEESMSLANALIEVAPGEINQIVEAGSINVIDYATEASKTTRFNRSSLYTVAGIILGAAIAFSIVFLKEMTTNTIKSVNEVETKLGSTVLGAIPIIEIKKNKANPLEFTGQLISQKGAKFSYVEAFKSLRVKIEALNAKKGFKSFIVTSTQENEGKTSISVNLALALAKKGKKVILCDCDLRKPSIHKLLSIKKIDGIGLIPLLTGKSTIEKSILYSKKYDLYVVPSGGTVDHAAELLDSLEMKVFLNRLDKEITYDYLILDTPPAIQVTDAEVLSRYVDSVVMVVREDTSLVQNIRLCIANLDCNKAEVAGCVINAVEDDLSLFGYGVGRYYKSGYRNGYSGYSNKKEGNKDE